MRGPVTNRLGIARCEFTIGFKCDNEFDLPTTCHDRRSDKNRHQRRGSESTYAVEKRRLNHEGKS